MGTLILDGENLTVADVVRVARSAPGEVQIMLSNAARARIAASRSAVERLVAEGQVAYGITTGFGAFKDHIISREQLDELQRNLVLSHSVGVGPPFAPDETRALILVRANQLAKGLSGVRPAVIELLLELLHRGVFPVIPQQGSLGTSGDLAPLAHLALALIGEGTAVVDGQTLPAREALARVGLEPVVLRAKEGLALLNGTAVMTGVGALVTHDAEMTAHAADSAGALTLEALEGTGEAFDRRLQHVRPHPRQVEAARYLRRLLVGSEFTRGHDPTRVQDAYSLRCIPQVHGAVRDAIAYARWVLEIELNSATDNPLIFVEGDQVDVLSGGNFHGEPVALAMDYLAMALTELGNISERRINRLMDVHCNEGLLPPFLTEAGGLNSGFMLAHYTAAALASENKVLAHPASSDSIPTSADVEDHQSLGTIAARQARDVLMNTATIIAIELFAAAQGIDFRRRRAGRALQLGRGTAPVYNLIRSEIPFLERDTLMHPYILAATRLVRSGAVDAAAQTAVARSSNDERTTMGDKGR